MEQEEDYTVPAGSATMKINGTDVGEIYFNDTANNAIVNALTDAVSYLQTSIPQAEDGNVHIDITVTAGIYEGDLDLSEGSTLQTALRDAITNYLDGGQSSAGGEGSQQPSQGEGDEENKYSSYIFSKENFQYPYGYISIVTDQYESGSESDGSATMDGNVLSDGFELFLAGLYFANQEKISIKNALEFSYEGTSLDDNVIIETENVGEVNVDTKDGDDRVEIQVIQTPSASVSGRHSHSVGHNQRHL